LRERDFEVTERQEETAVEKRAREVEEVVVLAFEPPFAKEGLAALFDLGRQGGVDHVVVVDVDLVVQPPGRVGQPTVVIADFGQYPALVALAADEGLAGFVLRRQRI
jgi:hypothetical protein